MQINSDRIKSLQRLLKELTGKDYSDEQAHEAGMAILRFVIAKRQREHELMKDENYELKIPGQ